MKDTGTKPEWVNTKRLYMQGLKPSDYYLYDQERKFFDFTMRALMVLGLRFIYSAASDPQQRSNLIHLANEIHQEDLDFETNRPVYKEFSKIMDGTFDKF